VSRSGILEQMREAKDRLCVALDVPKLAEAESLVRELHGSVGMFKIGLELYSAEGPRAVERVRELGGRVFLDLKLHDIPNTVARAARVLTRLGASFFNMHASGGSAMLRAAVDAVADEAVKAGVERPGVLGVTLLTSVPADVLHDELAVSRAVPDHVIALARLAQDCGLAGVVASAQEARMVRNACGVGFTIVTPGIRPRDAALADQRRVTTPAEALALGSDYIVVGRPILDAPDRAAACRAIVDELAGALQAA